MNRDQAVARARAARVGRMSTVRADGRPHVVPFVFALTEDGSELRAYWVVDRKPKRSAALTRIENLERNPAVEFVVDGYDEDWDRLWWVRCSGAGRIVGSADERIVAMSVLQSKYPQYVEDPPLGPVVAIDIDTVAGWEATPSPG